MAHEKNPELEAILAPAVEFFQQLDKLLRAHRMYEPGHVTIDQFEQRLFDSLTKFLDMNDELTVAVKAHEFIFTGEIVYHNEDKRENVSFRLHQDGIRQLTFRHDISREELQSFVKILRTDFELYDFCDDDSVTLLWKAGFEHVSYVVVETFIESGRESEDLEVLVDRLSQRFLRDTSPAELGPLLSGAAPGVRRRLKRKDAEAILNLPDLPPGLLAGLDHEVEKTRKQLNADDEAMIQRILLVLFRVLLTERDGGEFDQVATVTQRLLASLVRLGNLNLAGRIYGKLRELGDPSRNPSPENAKLMQTLYLEVQKEEHLKKVHETIEDPKFSRFTEIDPFVSALSPDAVPQIFRWMTSTKRYEVRSALIPPLARLAAGQLDLLAGPLRGAEYQLALSILDLLKTIGPATTAAQIRRGYSHADPRVRARVLDLLWEAGGDHARGVCVSGLKDADKTNRLKALQFLVKLNDRKLVKPLFDTVQEQSFDDREADEKRHLFLALAHLGGASLLDFFTGQLNQGILNLSDRAQERIVAAVWALAAIGGPVAKSALEEQRDRALAPKAVKEACDQALRRFAA